MSKRPQITKLLAVVALATSPAAAAPQHIRQAPVPAQAARPAVEQAVIDPWAGQEAPIPTPPVAAQHQPAEIVGAVLTIFGISAPRRLATGAPACGNVQSRAARPTDCEPAPVAAAPVGAR